jgi:transcriptional regulator with XRE-family HTH domain
MVADVEQIDQRVQEELASRIGTSHSQIARIESGQHKTSVETLRRVANAFGVRLVIAFEPLTPSGTHTVALPG